MTDNKKIIDTLRDCRRYLEDKEWSDNPPNKEYFDAITAAIDMFKEVEPEIHMGGISLKHDDPELIIYCGSCKGQMVCKYEEYPIDYMKDQYKYCHHCGKKVKWG